MMRKLNELLELDKLKSTIKLLAKLEEGEKTSKEEGWLSEKEIEDILFNN